jgi:dimethylhistidine N-methyltransferase
MNEFHAVAGRASRHLRPPAAPPWLDGDLRLTPVAADGVRLLAQARADDASERHRMLAGLLERPARIDSKYFYDALGSALYGAITRLPEYHPARLEAQILERHRMEIAAALPRNAQWVDLGCGDGDKAGAWLRATRARRYVGVDTAETWLVQTLRALVRNHTDLEAIGVIADLSGQWSLYPLLGERPSNPPLFFYPGSSIGNFVKPAAAALLRNIREHCGDDGCLLIGVDFTQDVAQLQAAYDDPLGVTASFNRNILRVVNRMLDASFDVRGFAHLARFNAADSRVEMHLLARSTQVVRFGTPPCTERNFELGETIITEYSHKYTAQCFTDMLTMAGFSRQRLWTAAAQASDASSYGVFLAEP